MIKRIDSAEGNVCKFVYTGDDYIAESVLYKYPTYEERTVICCSTQSGCPVGCRFCGAGDYFARSLTSDEICQQVYYSVEQTKVEPALIKRLQIMFMSMGEPLLNFKNLQSAIIDLNATYPQAALLISTIGPSIDYTPLNILSSLIPKIGLQFSVHKSSDEERNKLIPFKNKLSLKQIADKGNDWHFLTGRRPFFNYCASDDNTSSDDVKRLLSLFNPKIWECTISVICERNEGMPSRNDHQIQLARDFSEKMLEVGYNIRVFDPAGQDDIGGGCGQLWFVQQWMKDSPFARKSVGFDLPVLHTPGVKNAR